MTNDEVSAASTFVIHASSWIHYSALVVRLSPASQD
jgi:hypothetical protein